MLTHRPAAEFASFQFPQKGYLHQEGPSFDQDHGLSVFLRTKDEAKEELVEDQLLYLTLVLIREATGLMSPIRLSEANW